nr:acyl carrier protein [Cytophagales bacterium]
MSNSILGRVLNIIIEIKELDTLDKGILLIDSGILDSFDIIVLITKIEEEFKVSIPGSEIKQENFNSVEAIALLIEGVINAQK